MNMMYFTYEEYDGLEVGWMHMLYWRWNDMMY
jgi:hypothetical protein